MRIDEETLRAGLSSLADEAQAPNGVADSIMRQVSNERPARESLRKRWTIPMAAAVALAIPVLAVVMIWPGVRHESTQPASTGSESRQAIDDKLGGAPWRLTTLVTAGATYDNLAGKFPDPSEIQFLTARSLITYSDGCNGGSAPITQLSLKSMTVSAVNAVQQMAGCNAPEVNSVQAAFAAVIGTTSQLAIDGSTLTIKTGAGILTFTR